MSGRMDDGNLAALFAPLTIRAMTLPNRIVSTAHGVRLARDHVPTARDRDYYVEKAKGGAGLVIQEGIRVHPTSVPNSAAIVGYEDRVVDGLRPIAQGVHRHGAHIIGQIAHQGRQGSTGYARLPLWAPSGIPGYYNHETPHAMSVGEVGEVVAGHAEATRRVLAAGYDGVEIHAGHGYLLQEFLSPLTNRREDEYGGDVDGRLRIVRETIAAVRAAAGTAVVGLRVSGDEFTPGGLTIEDMCDLVARLLREREVDYVSVTQCNYEGASMSTMVPDMYTEPAAFTYLAREVKRVIPDVPVLAVGRITTPTVAASVLRETGADLVGMTRAQIADQQLAVKAREGRSAQIRPCVGLNVCWRTSVAEGFPVTCAVNPTAGREGDWGAGSLPRVDGRRVTAVVVGGGPAGLEAARVLGEAGCVVTLLERDERLGGQLRLAARGPGRADLLKFVDWATAELARLGVVVQFGAEATATSVLDMGPEAVVVATGSTSSIGAIRVAYGATVLNARELLAGDGGVGHRALVVDREWEWQAPSVAELLCSDGAEVQVATEKLHLGVRLPAVSLPAMYARLGARGIHVHALARIVAVDPDGVTAQNPFTGATSHLGRFDTVVVAGDSVADDALYGQLDGRHPLVRAAGDCVAPRQVMNAVYEGHAAARETVRALIGRAGRDAGSQRDRVRAGAAS